MSNFTSNWRHLAINAMRASGYEEDAEVVLDARLLSVTESGTPQLKLLLYFDSNKSDIPHGEIYLHTSATGTWLAEY
jgi:hypothetical protein